MTDIVKRLQSLRTEQGDMWPYPNLHEEAADEIERLRKLLAEADIDNIRVNYENERLREALKPFANIFNGIPKDYDEGYTDMKITVGNVSVKHLRSAAAAILENGDE